MTLNQNTDDSDSSQAKLSESTTDGSLDHLIHPPPLSHEFRFGTRGLLLLMLLVGFSMGLFRLGCFLFE